MYLVHFAFIDQEVSEIGTNRVHISNKITLSLWKAHTSLLPLSPL